MASNNGTPNASKGRLEMIKYGAFCLQFIHFPGRSRGQLEAILQEASFCVSSQPASATLWLAYYYAYSRWRVTHLDHLRQLEVRTVVYQYMHAVLRTHLEATRFVSCDAKSGVAYAGPYALLYLHKEFCIFPANKSYHYWQFRFEVYCNNHRDWDLFFIIYFCYCLRFLGIQV